MTNSIFSLLDHPLKIIDIGARAVPGEGPGYNKLFSQTNCSVTMVEPDTATNHLMKKHSNVAIHNIALGSGNVEKFHITNLPSCSSFLTPNLELLSTYSGMEFFYQIKEEKQIKTERLDDYFPEADFDYMDIDVQGYELEILKHGKCNLSNLIVLHIEVSFADKYINQPSQTVVNDFLIEHGMQFHCFTGYGTRAPNGLKINGSPINGINQWIWADAVYFHPLKDIAFWRQGSRLIKAASIFHCIYGSYDLAAKCLQLHDEQNNSKKFEEYTALLLAHEKKLTIEIAGDDRAYMRDLIRQLNHP